MTKKHVDNGKGNTRGNRNNRANQLNPNNAAYWKSRGHEGRPNDRNNTPPTRKK